MQRKHLKCRWKSKKIRSRKFYIIKEGYDWLVYVYFNSEKKLIDADIDFFRERIKLYEQLLNKEPQNLFEKDMYVKELINYFNRKSETIEKAICKMVKEHKSYRYVKDNKHMITGEGIEWLCKNCFKQKYLEVLEDYKMELTQKYIEAGYLYDEFFGKN